MKKKTNMQNRIPAAELRKLCEKNNWFLDGSQTQYDKLLLAYRSGSTLYEIVHMIWLCSNDVGFLDIKRTLVAAGFSEEEA